MSKAAQLVVNHSAPARSGDERPTVQLEVSEYIVNFVTNIGREYAENTHNTYVNKRMATSGQDPPVHIIRSTDSMPNCTDSQCYPSCTWDPTPTRSAGACKSLVQLLEIAIHSILRRSEVSLQAGAQSKQASRAVAASIFGGLF